MRKRSDDNAADEGWLIKTNPVLQDGRLVVATLTIQPKGGRVPRGGITARMLRGIKIGDFGIKVVMAPRRTRASSVPSKRADEAFYATLARDYVDAVTRNTNPKPIATLAAARGLSIERIRSQVHLARRNGFLTDASQGRVGGQLTEKARSTLQRIATESRTGGNKGP